MVDDKFKRRLRWRVYHWILYIVKNDEDGKYFVYRVAAGDSGAMENLAEQVLSQDKLSKTLTYTREQVIEIAKLAEHTDEQIETAFVLADSYDPVDRYDLCQMSDEAYERRVRNAKRRLAYWREQAREQMADDKFKRWCRWRVYHWILYIVKNDEDGKYFVYRVAAGDSGAMENLAEEVLPQDKLSKTWTYTREQVIEIAKLAEHTDEQIEAAFVLADSYDPVDRYDLCQMSDEAYERRVRNAKRRMAYWRKRARELKDANNPRH